VATHDEKAAELPRHKLGRISADDADGYHRVSCPAVMGKLRCPLRAGLDGALARAPERADTAGAPAHLL
jgi:hypothetical protein